MLAQVIPMQKPEAYPENSEDWKVPVFERLNACKCAWCQIILAGF